jgi:predicted small lipoprotein YifL
LEETHQEGMMQPVNLDRKVSMKKSALIMLLLAATTLTACGRRGQLEAPSATANPQTGEKAEAAPAEDKPFILDGLIK